MPRSSHLKSNAKVQAPLRLIPVEAVGWEGGSDDDGGGRSLRCPAQSLAAA